MRCYSCGDSGRHMRDWERDLIEAGTMCRTCLIDSLTKGIREALDTIDSLVGDLEPLASSGYCPEDIEADITALAAAAKECARVRV